jgi:hypothetical protein
VCRRVRWELKVCDREKWVVDGEGGVVGLGTVGRYMLCAIEGKKYVAR